MSRKLLSETVETRKDHPSVSRQRIWQLRMRTLGRCEKCGQQSAKNRDGKSKLHCDFHARQQRHYKLKAYYKRKSRQAG